MPKKGAKVVCLIKIQNLEKSFGGRRIINNISYNFYGGHVYGIVGKNGAGKSVLLKLLLKAASPDKGSVIYGDIENRKPVVSCVIDGCDLYMNLSGLDNLVYLSGFRKRTDLQNIKRCMREVGLDPDNKNKIKKYSLGMRKRLLIAQAVMENPDILIFDEPANSLDSEGVDILRRIIKESREKGKLIIMASHYKDDIEDVCDTVLEMKGGVLC